ncbi:MAG: alpha/beta hydrolase [Sulfuricaulis sp.]
MLIDKFDGPQHPDTLLVLLPPAGARAEHFYDWGFVADVRQRAVIADLLLVDITYRHLMAGSVVPLLRQHVLERARTTGYRHIWLTGISLGAFNALYFAAACAEHLAGIYLMAPYPGTHDVLAEIRAAGGPAAWSRTQQSEGGDERIWWRWLCRAAETGQWPTSVYLGMGNQDRFLLGQRLIASMLPPGQVSYVPGSHVWPTWRRLWQGWLAERSQANCLPRSSR